MFAPERVEVLKACGKDFVSGHCLGEGSHRWFKRIGCKDKLCRWCSEGYTEKLTDCEMEFISQFYEALGESMNWWGWEFTMPKRYSRKVVDDPEGMKFIRDLAVHCMNEVMSDGGRYLFYIRAVAQWWSSSNPFGAPHAHVHIRCLDRAVDKKDFVEGVDGLKTVLFVKRGGYRRDVETLSEAMSRLWKAGIEARYGVLTTAARWNVHYEYGKGNYNDMRHTMSYLHRSPVKDVYRLVTSAISPVEADPVWVKRLLTPAKYDKLVQNYGWGAPCVRNRYAKLVMRRCWKCRHPGHPRAGESGKGCSDSGCLCEDGRPFPPRAVVANRLREVLCPEKGCGCSIVWDWENKFSIEAVRSVKGRVIGYG